MTTTHSSLPQTPFQTRETRPFVRLEPIPIPARLPRSAQDGLAVLEGFVQRHAHALMRALVGFSFSTPEERRAGVQQQHSASVLNRRRRAALEWIQAILAGRIDGTTLHSLSHTWVPQLAGTGPDLHRCQERASDFVEYLRGAITGLILDRPQANLVPEAKALHALETILAVHLGAVRNAVVGRAPARARAPVS